MQAKQRWTAASVPPKDVLVSIPLTHQELWLHILKFSPGKKSVSYQAPFHTSAQIPHTLQEHASSSTAVQTLRRKVLSQKYFLKILISASNKCSAVWLTVRVNVSDEWTNCREASSLRRSREKPGERLPWKLNHHTSIDTASQMLPPILPGD